MAYFVPYSRNNGKFNMETDELLLDYAINRELKSPILRLYGWSPSCVSLGRNQTNSNINNQYCVQNNIDIVHRQTGGRALLHEEELTYSFITPIEFLKNGESIKDSYKEISNALIEGFSLYGIELTFPSQKEKSQARYEYCMSISTGADLSYQGKKLIGSAQFRKQKYILQHGSILFRYDKELIQNIFGENLETSKITTLEEIQKGLGRKLSKDFELEELCNSIKIGFEHVFKECFNSKISEL